MSYTLVLGGGSLRGAAHIGILEVLLENNYTPEMLVGTSAGSLVAALYAAGYSLSEISNFFTQEAKALAWPTSSPLSNRAMITGLLGRLLPLGLIPEALVESLLKKAFKNVKFTDLKSKLAITATNLYNGEITVFTSRENFPDNPPPGYHFMADADVQEAVHASIAIPGVFHPKKIEEMTFVDGGLVANVPADIASILGAKKILAVDLGFAVQESHPFDNLIQVLLQTFDIMGQRVSNMLTQQYASLVLHPQVGSANLWDFAKIPEFINQGKLEAEKKLPAIKAILP